MQTDAAFWTRVAPKYAKRPISDLTSYEHTLSRIRDNISPTSKVLELGCGTGGTALKLAGDAAEILATDISEGMISEAMKRPQADNVRFAVAEVFSPTLEKHEFDVVLALNLIHLLPNTTEYLNRVRALLKPGALFISKTPCLSDGNLGFKFGLMKAAIPIMQWMGKAPYVRFFSARELEADIEAAGFQVIETGNFPVRPSSRFVVARAV
ncbi:MAG: methyltransferase domain-containing protein [Pseudomonadota bacterium]